MNGEKMKRISSLNIEVGEKLKNARLVAGYTQEQVAEIIDCSSRYISQLETNRTLGSIDSILRLCNLYKITLNDIYSEYFEFKINGKKDAQNIIGYNALNNEYKSIVDNTIQYLNNLLNQRYK